MSVGLFVCPPVLVSRIRTLSFAAGVDGMHLFWVVGNVGDRLSAN